ncbi:MAG TPA: hypothetical protein VKC16_10080 [Xanthobacteraceae bacterium]|nr:hypothetical protein [Xanthobacteraceae bacterium]
MTDLPIRALLLAGLIAAIPAGVDAQAPLSPEDQISPRQMQNAPSAQPGPRPNRAARPAPEAPPGAAADNPAAPAARKPAPGPRSVACSGVFAKDSSHLKLAQSFEAKNIEFGAVPGPEGTSLNASILYGGDPKRRLEVLWQNEAARSDVSLIVITGQSQWSAPKGLRLGLALAALEKLNGKPFKLSGFDQPDGGSVLDWQGGALAVPPGGCKVGLRLAPDPKAPQGALAAAAGKEFLSTDAAMRAAKPVVAEIVLGYQ